MLARFVSAIRNINGYHIIQMSYLEGVVRNFAEDITRNRRYNYSHDALEEYLLAHPEIGCATFKVSNRRNENLETMMLKTKKASSCIVYAHGLGSNKLEALPLAKFFPRHGYDICSFDFSSSGRSQGSYTSYGLLQQEDIHSILAFLDSNCSYQQYILWGRSMGSVSIILSQGTNPHKKVNCIILDSPFSSFEKAAIEIASKKSLIPQFMIGLLIEPLKSFCQTQHPINPFEINIVEKLKKIDCKILFVYSKNDSVVSYTHSLELSKECRRTPIEVEIQEDHNMQRSRQTHLQILKFMERCHEEYTRRNIFSRSKNRGISITSKEGKDKEISVRNNSKIKLSISEPNVHNYQKRQRSIKTIATLNQSIEYSKRMDTDESVGKRRNIGAISSLCMDERLHQLANKENIKPSLNMMRKNRFR